MIEPSKEEIHQVTVRGLKSETAGQVIVQEWTATQAFRRGGRKSLKVVGTVALCLLPLAAMDPFMFMFWGSATGAMLFLVVGPVLHLKLWGERRSFNEVTAPCPDCGAKGPLKPFLHTSVAEQFNVLCASCGATLTAVLKS